MQWLNKVIDQAEQRRPKGEIIIESGVSPSGTYHVGTLREVLTCDAVLQALKLRGRQARHIHYVDDMDVFRKVPLNVPPEFKQYLGRPVCDIPAPDGSSQSYADYFLNDFLQAATKLQLSMEVVRSHERYRDGSMTPAIEKALGQIETIRRIIEDISGRQLEKDWAPIQVMEGSYLKSRRFLSIDRQAKTVDYLDADDHQQTVDYTGGLVKLNWRVDWPARWWLMRVDVEPFGRDHATKGGSYDTGAAIVARIFETQPPIPLGYNFINRAGETKKMSKSTGDIIAISEMANVLPPEVIRFFTLRYPPDKQLFFDPQGGVVKLIDDYAALLAKPDKSADETALIRLSTASLKPTVSNVPFSHLVASYQAALKDPAKTLAIIKRTEHANLASAQEEVIKTELGFIDQWLKQWAPSDAKFELIEKVNDQQFTDSERQFLKNLAAKIETAPQNADGQWFHQAVYELKEAAGLEPKQAFGPLYRALIGQEQGPRAGWFLSILPRDWLIKRLRFEA